MGGRGDVLHLFSFPKTYSLSLLQGTSRRSRSGLEQEVENMGGQLNAYTSREQTVYFIHVFSSDVVHAVDILSDILQNSELSVSRMEAERSTILRESQEVYSFSVETLLNFMYVIVTCSFSMG